MLNAVTRPDPPAAPQGRWTAASPPATVLLLTADTGGGHRASTEAVREEIAHRYGEQLTSIVLDPMTGPSAPWLVAKLALLYGPLVRRAPWLWGALFHVTDVNPMRWLLTRLVTIALRRTLREALERHAAEVVVVFHPLLVPPVVSARRGQRVEVVVMVTDLGRPHSSWWHPGADHVVVPTVGLPRGRAGASLPASRREHPFGLPVRRQFTVGGDTPAGAAARRRLGLDPHRFVVMVNGGGEGARGTERWARALIAGPADVDVVVVCGRNERLRRRLAQVTPRPGRRLVVAGFVDDMAAHMSSADLLVTKAGPGIIAEAAALGLPVVVRGHLPGQEAGNREHVVRTGAGIAVDSDRELLAVIERMHDDPALVGRLRTAARRAGRPGAGARVADLIMTVCKETR